MAARTRSIRQDQAQRARDLRAMHRTWTEVAAEFATRYDVNFRVAFRLAHCWSQGRAAEEWNSRWPAEPKTFKSFSYWELWPASTGHAPSLEVLGRLAELYECRVADLLADCADFRPNDPAHQARAELAGRIEEHQARAESAGRIEEQTDSRTDPEGSETIDSAVGDGLLSGIWLSRYRYHSDGRDQEVENEHYLVLHHHRNQVTAQSLPNSLYSLVRLDLRVDWQVLTGTWSERTSPTGYYKGAAYHGALQLMVDPTARSMAGRWVGFDMAHQVNDGPWSLAKVAVSTAKSVAREFHFRV